VSDPGDDFDDFDDDEPEGVDAGPPVTVALLHPDASRRSLLARKLERSPGIEVVLSVGDLDDGVDQAIEVLPDVLALFPADDLLAMVSRIEHEAPAVSVLVLDPGPESFGALGAGARGTLPSGGSEITKAVTGIARDETVLTPEWAGQLLVAIDEIDEQVRRLALLSETEREVLGRLAAGDNARTIADDHEVSERLVNLHVGYAVGKYHQATEALRALARFEAARAAAEGAPVAPPEVEPAD
jgi:two-component system response regulator DevR